MGKERKKKKRGGKKHKQKDQPEKQCGPATDQRPPVQTTESEHSTTHGRGFALDDAALWSRAGRVQLSMAPEADRRPTFTTSGRMVQPRRELKLQFVNSDDELRLVLRNPDDVLGKK